MVRWMKRKKGQRKKGRKESNFIIPKSKNSFLIAFEAGRHWPYRIIEKAL
jgi:hypothetical protein